MGKYFGSEEINKPSYAAVYFEKERNVVLSESGENFCQTLFQH